MYDKICQIVSYSNHIQMMLLDIKCHENYTICIFQVLDKNVFKMKIAKTFKQRA